MVTETIGIQSYWYNTRLDMPEDYQYDEPGLSDDSDDGDDEHEAKAKLVQPSAASSSSAGSAVPPPPAAAAPKTESPPLSAQAEMDIRRAEAKNTLHFVCNITARRYHFRHPIVLMIVGSIIRKEHGTCCKDETFGVDIIS